MSLSLSVFANITTACDRVRESQEDSIQHRVALHTLYHELRASYGIHMEPVGVTIALLYRWICLLCGEAEAKALLYDPHARGGT